MNVVYIDGHGETLVLPVWGRGREPGNEGDLGRVGLSKGIYE